MEAQINLYRHEVKYFISKREAAELRLYLKNNMYLDPHADETGSYMVRSLYFDTIGNKDYYEKVIGYNVRKKIRLRIYNLSSDNVKLEIKSKNNNFILKETATISCEDANKLISGDCSPLLSYKENVTNKVFVFMHQELYKPKVIVDYQREAYLYNFQNLRITLDKDLSASFNSQRLFSKEIAMIPVINSDVFVLEIKYDNMLPVFLEKVLSNFAIQKSQISKYCLGRNILGV